MKNILAVHKKAQKVTNKCKSIFTSVDYSFIRASKNKPMQCKRYEGLFEIKYLIYPIVLYIKYYPTKTDSYC